MSGTDINAVCTGCDKFKDEADANDPIKLKAKIRELEKRSNAPAAVQADDKALERARAEGLKQGYDLAASDYENLHFPSEMRVLADIGVVTY